MKIIVISDTHGYMHRLKDVVEKNKDADLILHLGDGVKEFFEVKKLYPDLSMNIVRGNCDLGYDHVPNNEIFDIDSHKIFASHGYMHNVKDSIDNYVEFARGNGADIILYGHTHKRLIKSEDNLYIMNPGSLSCPRSYGPSYGILNIDDNIIMEIVEYEN